MFSIFNTVRDLFKLVIDPGSFIEPTKWGGYYVDLGNLPKRVVPYALRRIRKNFPDVPYEGTLPKQ